MNNNSASSRTEYSYEPMARYHALAATIKPPKGAKTTEELEILRQSNPCYGLLAPRKDRPGRHEVSYDCMIRFNTLAPTLKTPRGFKDTAHLENLRQSDPCYGTLAPRRDRPGRHEVSYDCMDRYTTLAPLLKLPKGAKTVEHERHNRASNPCYGSLAPRKDRPGRHEVTYDPLERYTTLAPQLKTPKGAKTIEHLEILRTSDPSLGSLAPRRDRPGRHEVTYDCLDRYIALARSLRTPKGTTSREHKEVLRTSNPSALAPRALLPRRRAASSATATRRRARASRPNPTTSSPSCRGCRARAPSPRGRASGARTPTRTRRSRGPSARPTRSKRSASTSSRSSRRTRPRVGRPRERGRLHAADQGGARHRQHAHVGARPPPPPPSPRRLRSPPPPPAAAPRRADRRDRPPKPPFPVPPGLRPAVREGRATKLATPRKPRALPAHEARMLAGVSAARERKMSSCVPVFSSSSREYRVN